MCLPSARGVQKRESDTLELHLQTQEQQMLLTPSRLFSLVLGSLRLTLSPLNVNGT